MNYSNLQIGEKIYYSGDQANIEGFGTITNTNPNGWYGMQYEITMEDERIKKAILPLMFEKSPGRRFQLLTEYNEEREKIIAQMKARYL